jgi:hypothetical protein
MFAADRKEINAFYDYYKAKFNEEVNIMMGVLELEDLMVDLIIGDSEEIHGVRVFRTEDHPDDCTCPECTDHPEDCQCDECREHPEDCQCADCTDHPEDCTCEECSSEDVPAVVYDLIRVPKAKITGKPIFQIFLEDTVADEEEHPEDCTCPECTDHPEDCDCEYCKEHPEDCDCEDCKEHPEDCKCPECSDEPTGDENLELTIYSEDGSMDSKVVCAVLRFLKEDNRQEVFLLDEKLFDMQVLSI